MIFFLSVVLILNSTIINWFQSIINFVIETLESIFILEWGLWIQRYLWLLVCCDLWNLYFFEDLWFNIGMIWIVWLLASLWFTLKHVIMIPKFYILFYLLVWFSWLASFINIQITLCCHCLPLVQVLILIYLSFNQAILWFLFLKFVRVCQRHIYWFVTILII